MLHVTNPNGVLNGTLLQVVARISLIHATTLAPFLTLVASLRHFCSSDSSMAGSFWGIFHSDKFLQNSDQSDQTPTVVACSVYIYIYILIYMYTYINIHNIWYILLSHIWCFCTIKP